MEGAARDRLVAVRRCGGTPMRQKRRPEGPSSWAGSAVLGSLVSYMTLAGCISASFWASRAYRCKSKARGDGIDACADFCDA